MDRRVFTYKDVEEARAYIGKSGRFSDSLAAVECGDRFPNPLRTGRLVHIRDPKIHDCVFTVSGANCYQFFSPDPEPVEKWVMFTEEDWPEFWTLAIRPKGWVSGGSAILSWGEAGVNIFNAFISYEELLEKYERIGGFPLGKKVTE